MQWRLAHEKAQLFALIAIPVSRVLIKMCLPAFSNGVLAKLYETGATPIICHAKWLMLVASLSFAIVSCAAYFQPKLQT